MTAVVDRETTACRNPDEVSREALVLLDRIEELLSDKVPNYAVRAQE
ncbi:hypothetical protein ACWDWT_37960 [Streptomyces sp. NPDC003343]